jgi:dienelactone hydrolase
MSWPCRESLLKPLVAIAMLTTTATATVPTPVTAGSPTSSSITWRPTGTPEHGDVGDAEWLEIDVPGPPSQDRRILAAVFRPEGEGPFPVVVYLHGGSGLSTGMLRWAPQLSEAGFLVLAGCYVLTLRATNRIACPDGPTSDRGVAALLDVATQLPDARRDGLGVLGLSLGARMAFATLGDPRIRAVVADSGDPGVGPLVDPSAVGAAVLLLAYEQDGGVNEPALRRYDQKLRDLGKPIESRYFDGIGHVVTLSQETRAEATALTLDFFGRHLREMGCEQ